MKRLLYFILILLVGVGCRPCAVPEIKLPSVYMQENCVQRCQSDLPEADLAHWWAQFDDPLLIYLVEKGLAENYDLGIAREKICEARAIFKQNFSSLLPWVDGLTLFNRSRNSQTLAESPFIGGKFVNFYQLGFDAFWEIDLFGKNLDRARAACLDVAAQYAQVRDVHVSVSGEIAVNYFRIRTLQERIEITKRHIASEAELLGLVKERYEAGLISYLDVNLSDGLLKERNSILHSLEAEYYQAVFALAILISELPSEVVNYFCETKELPCTTARFPLGLPSELLCRRGDVRAAEFKMRAAGARVLSARKEIFPTLSLSALYSYATGFFTDWFKADSRSWSLTPSLTLPIFHGGEIMAHIAYETSLQRQAVLEYQKRVLEAVKEVENALVGYFQQGARCQTLQEEVAAYKEARQLAQELFFGGLEDFLYVIETERNLFFSQMELARAKEDLMTQLVAVYKALGGGWE
ncbi:MAG: efflux transporter outer membrane subunit [Chlamydiales bacterium]|nr:efflux transporter outer membrane subunit [Chlamydiales bacterium]